MSPETSDPLWALSSWYSGQCPTLSRRRRSEKGSTVLKASARWVSHLRQKYRPKQQSEQCGSPSTHTVCLCAVPPENWACFWLLHEASDKLHKLGFAQNIADRFHWSSATSARVRHMFLLSEAPNFPSTKHGGHRFKVSPVTSRSLAFGGTRCGRDDVTAGSPEENLTLR